MKKYTQIFNLLIFLFILNGYVYAQYIINFGEIVAGKDTTVTLTVTNTDNLPWNILKFKYSGDNIRDVTGPQQLSAGESADFYVTIHCDQNVNYSEFLVIDTDQRDPVYVLSWQGIFNDYSDPISKNLWDENLKQSLKNYLQSHTSLTYSVARDSMFTRIDNINDSIECVYTGRKIYLDHNSSTPRSDAYNQNINTEHTFPQGLFNSDLPMRSDLYHLFPTDVTANNKRGSYPFGNVVSNIQYENGGSRLGQDMHGNTVFEPRSVHKGNVARAMFYFVVCYQNYSNFLDSQEAILREWNLLDPVDQKEIRRNNIIGRIQGRRNPFIDHPQLIDRIINFSHAENRTWYPELILSSDTIRVSGSDTVKLYVFNHGRGDLQITQIQSNDPGIRTLSSPLPLVVSYGKLDSLQVIIEDTWQGGEAEITIYTNEPSTVKTLIVKQDPNSISEETSFQKSDITVFPNPFNSSFRIIPASFEKVQSVAIYDLMGRKVYFKRFNRGSDESDVIIDFSARTSGIYFLKIETQNSVLTQKIIYLR